VDIGGDTGRRGTDAIFMTLDFFSNGNLHFVDSLKQYIVIIIHNIICFRIY
jgi:hypothetical protein